MSSDKLSIDDVLKTQSSSALRATVEAVEEKSDFVKITPWMGAGGCLCHLAIQLKKTSLDGVTVTSDTHVCCGKTLKVVELHFKKDAAIMLDDLFQQLHSNATNTNLSEHHSRGLTASSPFDLARVASREALGVLNPRASRCFPKYASCISGINPFMDQRTQFCLCANELKICTGQGVQEICPDPRY
jgi:hypothetical protein